MAEKHCKLCVDCIHHGTCYREGNKKAYKGDLDISECALYKSAADVAEVRHGEWLPTSIPSYFGGFLYKCSECSATDREHSTVLGTYCWRCGAKMNEERKEQDNV